LSLLRNKSHTEVGVGLVGLHKKGPFFWCVLFTDGKANSTFVLENRGAGIKQKKGCYSGSNTPCSGGQKHSVPSSNFFFMCYVFILLFKLWWSIYTDSRSSRDNSWDVFLFIFYVICLLFTFIVSLLLGFQFLFIHVCELLTETCEGKITWIENLTREGSFLFECQRMHVLNSKIHVHSHKLKCCTMLVIILSHSEKCEFRVIQKYSSEQNILSLSRTTFLKTYMNF